MKRVFSIGAAVAIAAVSVATWAQNAPNPEQQAKGAIETRQGLYKLLGAQMGPIGGMLRNQVPFDAAVVARNAERIQVLAGMIPEVHALDTRQFKNIKTGALDGIWNSQADFKAKADALGSAAGTLATTAKGGDRAATLKAAGEIGKACGSCHDSYRQKQ